MILEAETSLLIAVRARLLATLEMSDDQVDIEIDDVAPAMIGQVFYCISPSGAGAGRYSQQADMTTHNVFGVRVAVMERITDVPRDRRRDTAFLDRLRSINGRLSQVSRLLRFDYQTLVTANAELALLGIPGKFHRPLVPMSVDGKPRMLTSDVVGAKATNTGGDLMVVMVRGIDFGGAEFIGMDQ